MSIIAKQSTARTVIVGPILDEDGVAVTGAAVGDLKIAKNGGAPAALNGSATLTHRHTGMYSLALTTSDVDTVGQAEVTLDKTTDAMPVKAITVVEEAVYDALFAASATGKLPANLTEWLGSTPAALTDTDKVQSSAQHMADGLITAAKLASDAITAAKVAADAVAEIQSGLGTAANQSTIAGYIDTEIAAIISALATAQADLDAITGIDGAKLATAQGNYAPAKAGDQMDLVDAPNANAVTAIQSGLGTAANQSTIAGYIDTEIASIISSLSSISSAIAALNDLDSTAAEAAALAALVSLHLDHLLSVDYDPSSKPGTATALLNELVESDSGVSRFTANALEQGPSGGGGGGSVTVESLEAAALLQLAGLQLRVSSPANGPNEPLVIVRGDDYLDADGRAQTFTLTGDVPDLTAATGTLTLKLGSTTVAFDIETPTQVGSDWQIKVEMTTAETAALTVSTNWKYDLQLTLNTAAKYTPYYKRSAHVVEDYTS